ncbi:MAG TPA: hypothetical protein VGB91_00810, partial [Rhizomicrobium sp.]
AAAITGFAALALAPAACAAIAAGWFHARAIATSPRRAWQGVASSLCFVGAISLCAGAGVDAAMLLFCGAGLLGAALALVRSEPAVEQHAGIDVRRAGAIGGDRRV